MPLFHHDNTQRVLALASLSLAMLAGACTQNGGETDAAPSPESSTPQTSTSAPSTPDGSASEFIANTTLRLSLQNDTATPESVRRNIADGADPKAVYEGSNLLITAVNIKQNFKISDIDIDPNDKSKTWMSITDVQGEAVFEKPKDPDNIARICEVLIKAGADVNFTDWGGTPLNAAMRFCQTPSVKVLLDAGADPNLTRVPNPSGYTPLLRAVDNGCADSILLLLQAGAIFTPDEIVHRSGWGGKKTGTLLEAAKASPELEGTPALGALLKAAASGGDYTKSDD